MRPTTARAGCCGGPARKAPLLLPLLLASLLAPDAFGERLQVHGRATDRHFGHFDTLRVECEAVLDSPGTYEVTPCIRTADRSMIQGEMRPSRHAPGSDMYRTDASGHLRFQAVFDGDAVTRLRNDGPWWFYCRFLYLDNIDSVTHHPPNYAWIDHYVSQPMRSWRRARFTRRYHDELDFDYGGAWLDSRTRDQLVYTLGQDLVVATILGGDTAGTNQAPPRVRVRVEERLFGKAASGTIDVRWGPEPLSMPCMTGEEENIRRWESTALVSPPVGSRWILGVQYRQRLLGWDNMPRGRWPYSDSLLTYFAHETPLWPERLDELRRLRAQDRRRGRIEDQLRRRRERVDYVRRERQWLARERRLEAETDLVRLVNMSSEVAVGRWSGQGYAWDWYGTFTVSRWLRCSQDSARAGPLQVFVGAPADPAAIRWDEVSRSRPGMIAGGQPAIVFLRKARAPLTGMPPTLYRFAEPVMGLMLATPRDVRRVTRALPGSPGAAGPPDRRAVTGSPATP